MTIRPNEDGIPYSSFPRGLYGGERSRSHLPPAATGDRSWHLARWWQVAGASQGRILCPLLISAATFAGVSLW